MSFSGLARRAKKTEKNEKGRFKRKKRFGKSIANCAPAMLLDLIDEKLQKHGESLIKIDTIKAKASQFDHVNKTYTKKKLSKRWNNINGLKIQRDLYSAFLVMNINPDLKSFNLDKCNNRFNTFFKLHQEECLRLHGKNNPSSMGI